MAEDAKSIGRIRDLSQLSTVVKDLPVETEGRSLAPAQRWCDTLMIAAIRTFRVAKGRTFGSPDFAAEVIEANL